MKWKHLGTITTFHTPWIELVGERWRDDTGKDIDYWRVIAANSVIIVVEHAGDFLLPEPMFRPGVNRATLDFPGGRLPTGMAPEKVARAILSRELDLSESDIVTLRPLTEMPLLVNSSTSNQTLYGFHAMLAADLDRARLAPHRVFPAGGGATGLLAELDCLQCRALLLERLCASLQHEPV